LTSRHCEDRPDPDITEVRVASHGVLWLTFSEGGEGEVAVLDRMRGPVFADARTPEGFARHPSKPGLVTTPASRWIRCTRRLGQASLGRQGWNHEQAAISIPEPSEVTATFVSVAA
jgi:hypothetical protein